MDSNLLKEAIADAKAVRQTALANAKAVLEEAFGNRLEAMFAPQLEEETADVIAPATSAAQTAPAAPALEQEAVVNEEDIAAIIRELESEIPQDDAPAPAPASPDAAAVPPVSPDPLAAPAPPAPVPAPAPALGGAPMGGAPLGGAPLPPPVPPVPPTPAPVDASAELPPPPAPAAPSPAPDDGENSNGDDLDEEIDVNELLESLKDEEEEGEEMVCEDTTLNSSGVGSSDNKKPTSAASSSSKIETAGKDRVGGGEGYKNGPADATTASRPNQGKNVTKTNLSTPGGALKEATETGFPEGATVKAKDASEAERPNQGEHVKKDKLDTPGGALNENAKLKAQLKEAYDTVTFLKGQLNEINLLNAKLLYTNRLFKEFSMPTERKMKLVEMFDLAKNVREVKMTYATIVESLNFGADTKKKTSSKVQTITEGMASAPVAGTAPKGIITESAKSEMVSKFQKLAGIASKTK